MRIFFAFGNFIHWIRNKQNCNSMYLAENFNYIILMFCWMNSLLLLIYIYIYITECHVYNSKILFHCCKRINYQHTYIYYIVILICHQYQLPNMDPPSMYYKNERECDFWIFSNYNICFPISSAKWIYVWV
jgi:hypothetical protein